MRLSSFASTNRSISFFVDGPVVGGSVPVEEFAFYLLGFVTMLLLYVWCDEYWLGAYNVPDYRASARGVGRVVRFHAPSLLIGLALAVAGVVYKRLFSGTPGAIPGYFLFLVSAALVPSMFLFPTALPFINWRALSFTQ